MSGLEILIVTAVEAERDAVLSAVGEAQERVRVIVGGVGPAAAAAATAYALREPVQLVLCVGIGGGFAPLGPGDIAVASAIVFADLGAETSEGFAPLSELGFGSESYGVAPKVGVELVDRTGGHLGTIVTVATVTGSASGADGLIARFPDVVAEGMEGAGVAAAAQLFGVPFAEIRAISNAVGPRDRSSWQIPRALASLGSAVAAAVA